MHEKTHSCRIKKIIENKVLNFLVEWFREMGKKRCKENIFTARILTKNAEMKLTVILILIDRLGTVLKKKN